MPRIESQVAPWQTGDGRTQDLYYPSIEEWNVSANNQNGYVRHCDRTATGVFASAGTGSVTQGVRNDIPCAIWTHTAAAPLSSTLARATADWCPATPRLSPPALGGSGLLALQNFPYMQVYANIAYDAPPPVNADVGFAMIAPQFGFNTTEALFANVTTSILGEWTILADGRPAFCVRAVGGVGLSIFPFVSAIDITQFHCYEMRINQAGPDKQGSITALLDGAIHINLAYGPGTVLPPQNPGFPSFTLNVMNNGGTNYKMYVQQVAVRYAPSAPNLQ